MTSAAVQLEAQVLNIPPQLPSQNWSIRPEKVHSASNRGHASPSLVAHC